MTITVNILYQGEGEKAHLFADEMVSSGLVDKIRQQSGNLRYEYFVPLDNQQAILLIDEWENQEAIDIHHKSPMMTKIAELREKYQLRLKVTRYQQIDQKRENEMNKKELENALIFPQGEKILMALILLANLIQKE